MKNSLKTIGIAVFISLLAVAVFYVGLTLWGNWHDEWSGWNYSWQISDGECNIAVVTIDGEITTFPYVLESEYEDDWTPLTTSMSDVLETLNTAEYYDPDILGVLVAIDSPGGSGAASKEIADALKDSWMPNAAYTLDIAASGAYLVATGADRIFANPFSDIGSIGVTMSYLDYSKQNQMEGLQYIELASAKFKDSGDPDKSLSAEEKALFERDLAIHHDTFVREVAANRDLPVEKVAELADGSTLPASLALEEGLIDEIGGKEDVRYWFAEQLDMPFDEVIFCQ